MAKPLSIPVRRAINGTRALRRGWGAPMPSTPRAARGRLRVALALLAATSGAAATQAPDAMLATPMREGIDVRNYWISEKLDGVRARWDGQQLRTRSGTVVVAPDWFTAHFPSTVLDGELWISRGAFESISALVRTHAPQDPRWREVKFMAFDLPADNATFGVRHLRLRAVVQQAGVDWLQAIPQFRLHDHHQLRAKLREVVASGGEGLMLHHHYARYQAGRSEHLLKLKPAYEAQALVIGHLSGKGKYTGMLGALWVQRPDGHRFRLGTGFSDAQRARPPRLGSTVTYRYSGLTRHGLPRFARFVEVSAPPPKGN